MPYPTPKKSETAYTILIGSFNTDDSMDTTQSAPAPVKPVTPKMIQQMIISAFSALRFLGRPFSTLPLVL